MPTPAPSAILKHFDGTVAQRLLNYSLETATIVDAGWAELYPLDTNDPANLPEYWGITVSFTEATKLRINQEQVLGIGGWRLLRVRAENPTRSLPSQWCEDPDPGEPGSFMRDQ